MEIVDNVPNRKLISKIIDKNNSLDVDFAEINAFFSSLVNFENRKLQIENLETKEVAVPQFNLAFQSHLNTGKSQAS